MIISHRNQKISREQNIFRQRIFKKTTTKDFVVTTKQRETSLNFELFFSKSIYISIPIPYGVNDRCTKIH